MDKVKATLQHSVPPKPRRWRTCIFTVTEEELVLIPVITDTGSWWATYHFCSCCLDLLCLHSGRTWTRALFDSLTFLQCLQTELRVAARSSSAIILWWIEHGVVTITASYYLLRKSNHNQLSWKWYYSTHNKILAFYLMGALHNYATVFFFCLELLIGQEQRCSQDRLDQDQDRQIKIKSSARLNRNQDRALPLTWTVAPIQFAKFNLGPLIMTMIVMTQHQD